MLDLKETSQIIFQEWWAAHCKTKIKHKEIKPQATTRKNKRQQKQSHKNFKYQNYQTTDYKITMLTRLKKIGQAWKYLQGNIMTKIKNSIALTANQIQWNKEFGNWKARKYPECSIQTPKHREKKLSGIVIKREGLIWLTEISQDEEKGNRAEILFEEIIAKNYP